MAIQHSESIHPMRKSNGGANLRQIYVDETPSNEDEKPSHIEGEDGQTPTPQSLR